MSIITRWSAFKWNWQTDTMSPNRQAGYQRKWDMSTHQPVIERRQWMQSVRFRINHSVAFIDSSQHWNARKSDAKILYCYKTGILACVVVHMRSKSERKGAEEYFSKTNYTRSKYKFIPTYLCFCVQFRFVTVFHN